ncbi:Carboxypeptidase [Mycena venus]|uniref:Carboxypeptidase n=1 Tax=Mycena venus TaxID=2733690 RepID=A0A8H6Y130_9AGAR|nr:Carboxypeptidase [Mycena venus]
MLVEPSTTLVSPAPVKSSRYKSVVMVLRAEQAIKAVPNKQELKCREEHHKTWKRDLVRPTNGTLDPTCGCFLFSEMWDYALNFMFSWSLGAVDLYDIPYALNPEVLGCWGRTLILVQALRKFT